MITLNMMIHPAGSGIGRRVVLSGTICTSADGKRHEYELTQEPDSEESTKYVGSVPKTKSGHRNPINLLLNVAADVIAGRLEQDPEVRLREALTKAATELDLFDTDEGRQTWVNGVMDGVESLGQTRLIASFSDGELAAWAERTAQL